MSDHGEGERGEAARARPRQFVEGEDYYFEDGLMVLTAGFLRKRGYCCGNGCRNCPYEERPDSR